MQRDPRRKLAFERVSKRKETVYGVVTGVDSVGGYCSVRTDSGNRIANAVLPRGLSVSKNDRVLMHWDNAITTWRVMQAWQV